MSEPYQAGAQRALWALNARAVLEAVDREGPLGRPELVRATGLSRTTVTQTLRCLVAQGVVAGAGLDAKRRGPAAARCAEVAGVPLEAAGQAVVGVRAIVARDNRTVRTPAPALPGDGRGLVESLESVLPMPVLLENDVNLAAVAELHEGAGRGVADFVLLGLGDGLGAGVVLNRRLHRGYAGGAGDVRAVRVLERVAERLAVVIASLTLVIEPELVVIGGPFGHPALLDPVRSALARDAGPLVISLAASAVPADPVPRGALWQARLLAREAAFATAVATAVATAP